MSVVFNSFLNHETSCGYLISSMGQSFSLEVDSRYWLTNSAPFRSPEVHLSQLPSPETIS